MTEKQIFAKDLKVGHKVVIHGDYYKTVAYVELSSSGKSVFYNWENDNYKNKRRLGINSKVFILC